MSDITTYPDGIYAIDTHYVRPQFDAAHLVVHGGRAAFVDTGISFSVPRLLTALDTLGVARAAVDWVFLTHVHLDHAGGAGQLMQALPNASAVLHPRGAPHMINPAKLIQASIAVYGAENYARLYGEILPIDAARVVITTDGQRLSLADRIFEVVHTPGHALHHQAFIDYGSTGVADSASPTVFSGDTLGFCYREFNVDGRALILPTTTPSQFDPEQLLASIARLMAYKPAAAYLTHYSRVEDLPRLAANLARQVRAFAKIAQAQRGLEPAAAHIKIRAAMRALWLTEIADHGCKLSETQIDRLLGGDLDLNTDGLLAWLSRQNIAP